MYRILLIPDEQLRTAARNRALLALAVVLFICIGCAAGSAVGTAGLTFLASVHMALGAALARRWDRERGMWMLYLLLGGFSLWTWFMFRKPSPPAPGASVAMTIMTHRDEVFCGLLCMINLRLLASATVANIRRFSAS